MDSKVKKRWYVLQAFSGFETKVVNSINEQIKLHNMENMFGKIMVPTEEVVEIRRGQKKKE